MFKGVSKQQKTVLGSETTGGAEVCDIMAAREIESFQEWVVNHIKCSEETKKVKLKVQHYCGNEAIGSLLKMVCVEA